MKQETFSPNNTPFSFQNPTEGLPDKNTKISAVPHREKAHTDYMNSWNLQWPFVLVGPSGVRSHLGDINMDKLAYVVLIVIGWQNW